MCSTFSLSSKPCNGADNGKFLRSKSLVTRARAEVIAARKRSSQRAFLRLLKQGIPHTDLQVHEIVERQSQANSLSKQDICRKPEFHPVFLEEAYERCRNICAEYAKTFYLGTRLMTEERQKATWAIYGKRLKPRIDKLVLQRQYYQITYSSKKLLEKIFSSEDLRSNSVDPHSHTRDELSKEMRTDELVDGPNAVPMSTDVLDRWEERLQDIFDGRPYDMLDAALTDTISKFPLDIKPFRGMIEGMRMDTTRFRYDNFQELYLYCYYVAGTVGLMSVPVMGIAAESEASAQSIIMRHCAWVLEISLQTFLEMWERKEGASKLEKASRWPVWSSLLDYDNFTRRAYVGTLAYTKAQSMSSLILQGRQHFSELRTGDIINILRIHDQGNYHREDDREKPLSKSMFRGKITTKACNELSWET
uniref:15-cis-phytoene synthase n=1 Tax=Populus alba TaxID=43335 RepID=A0A4U5QNB3_POPAL|nr:hypothetical protein D5086_0000065520 [Populus alba]